MNPHANDDTTRVSVDGWGQNHSDSIQVGEGIPLADREVSDETRIEMEIREWWMRLASEEIEAVVPKAVEYGAADLRVMGTALVELLPNKAELSSQDLEQRGQEMAVSFYVLGKVARMFGAYAGGRQASDDTIHDVAVYIKMLQRIRDTGKWVG